MLEWLAFVNTGICFIYNVPVLWHNTGMDSNSELPVTTPKGGRTRSGKARMERLSPDERRDLAKRAAERRWASNAEIDPSVLIYQSEDQKTRIDVRLIDETVWLSQVQMAELFQRDKSVISRHIQGIYEEGELSPEGTVAKNATVQSEGGREIRRDVEFYNLDVIISVGYRVKSHRGVQFRIWATQRLKEYMVKGFALDDERLRKAGTRNDYFDELIKRVREIRTSERNFYRKITDVYATSIDYDAHSTISEIFFATVQNKFHYAIHHHTAAELIVERADASKPNMGLTCWEGEKVRKSDVTVAKNYLSQDEIESLNLLVDQYLSFAELQAKQRRVMHMHDWVNKLDDFMKLNDREILKSAGRISKKLADEVAEAEYAKYSHARALGERNADVSDFDRYVRRIESQRARS